MKIVIFGATGQTGLLLVEECLDKGHTVIAPVRSPEKLTVKHANLSVHKTDILQTGELTPQLKGVDAVMSCLGGQGGERIPCSVYTDSIITITDAMKTSGVSRLVCLTSWGTKHDPGLPYIIREVLRPRFLRNVLHNMAEMEDYLNDKCQDLDFTVVRPPGLTNADSTGDTMLTAEDVYVPNAAGTMPRWDVAKFMLQTLTEGTWTKKLVAIGLPPVDQ